MADEKLRLARRLESISKEMSACGLLYSGERNFRRVLAKEQTLHAWRDQERAALRFPAELEAREEWAHRLWRRLTRRPFPENKTTERAKPILYSWRQGETYDETPATPVEDRTARTLDRALAEMGERSP